MTVETRLLLDTNVVVWLLTGDRNAIPQTVVTRLTDPDATVLLSAASVWEIAIKRSLGKLTIGSDWGVQLTALDFIPLPVDTCHAAAVESLPWHHRDPFDRLLVAQAVVEDASLVTADRDIPRYGVRTLWSDDW